MYPKQSLYNNLYSPHRPIPQEYISGNSVRDCGKDWDFNRYSIGCDIWYDTFCKTEFCFIKILKSEYFAHNHEFFCVSKGGQNEGTP